MERGHEADVVAGTTTATLDLRLAATVTLERVVADLRGETGVLKLRVEAHA